MDMPKEFYDMVCADIKRLDNVRNELHPIC